jgi:serine/threonine-protein kinase HipA
MGRRSHGRALSVWANGVRVGEWRLPARGAMELAYDADWMHSSVGRPLSLSLPFGPHDAPLRGERVLNYFDNLLPDSDAIRKRIASKFRTPSADPFDLLQAIGRDCVGAVQLLAEDESPVGAERIDGTPVSDADIEALLQRSVSRAAFGSQEDEDDFRISLAGAQEKTALLYHDGRWMRPHGATPTTHILKLPLGLVGNKRADLTTSVENEWLCLELLKAYGLPVAASRIERFGAQTVLCVERFDRRPDPGAPRILRLPQEDFCQALGLSPLRKYEADGGPGIADLALILRGSEAAERDIETLLAAQILFWMLAAPDGHAKNFSIQLLAGGRYRMTPLYDVMSIWPVEGGGANQWSWFKTKLAMAVTGKSKHYLLKDIQRRHFNATAQRCFYGADAEPLIQRVIAATPGVIDTVASDLPADFPESVAERIFAGLRRSAALLESMPRD